MIVDLPTADDTVGFGRRLGALLLPGDLVSLVGDYGSGKTTMTRGIARGLGVDPATRIVSPTFVLLCIYQGRVPLFHYDIARLPVATELYDLDWDTAGEGVVVVEWGDRADGFKGCDHMELRLESAGDGRRLTVLPHGERYEELATKLAPMPERPELA
jgi:tRNA threonylcarbamoyladenosine biosynthesis protein TsaE